MTTLSSEGRILAMALIEGRVITTDNGEVTLTSLLLNGVELVRRIGPKELLFRVTENKASIDRINGVLQLFVDGGLVVTYNNKTGVIVTDQVTGETGILEVNSWYSVTKAGLLVKKIQQPSDK